MSPEDSAWAAYVARWMEWNEHPTLETMRAKEAAREKYLKTKGEKRDDSSTESLSRETEER